MSKNTKTIIYGAAIGFGLLYAYQHYMAKKG